MCISWNYARVRDIDSFSYSWQRAACAIIYCFIVPFKNPFSLYMYWQLWYTTLSSNIDIDQFTSSAVRVSGGPYGHWTTPIIDQNYIVRAVNFEIQQTRYEITGIHFVFKLLYVNLSKIAASFFTFIMTGDRRVLKLKPLFWFSMRNFELPHFSEWYHSGNLFLKTYFLRSFYVYQSLLE